MIKNNFFNNFKQFVKKRKKELIISSACVGAFMFPLSIYFTQTAYFYDMKPVKKTNNDITTLYGHDSRIIKKYSRKEAQIENTGSSFSEYPYPGNTNFKNKLDSDKKALVEKYTNEAKQLLDNNLLLSKIENGTLKKHPAIDYQYGYENRVLPSTKAVTKIFNIDLTQPGFITTGLFLPAGEILTIKFNGINDDDVKKLNLKLVLGESDSAEVKAGRSGWEERLPILSKTIDIDKATFKFGTPFGGIVHINNSSNPGSKDLKNIGLSIDGAIEALHYIHGYTSEQEWYRLVKETQAPIVDLSSDHLKFSGPKHELTNFLKPQKGTAPNPLDPKYYPFKVMDVLDKMALDSLYSINDANKRLQPVRINCSKFVPAGEAVSFVRAFFVIAPWYWMNSLLNYEGIINNGLWGHLHEVNHQHQQGNKWGYIGGGEVTNNVLTLISYLKFLNIASNRETATDHNTKVNGFLAQKQSGLDIMQHTDLTKEREGRDQDYSVVFANFGREMLQNIIRSYSNGHNINAFGNPLEPLSTTLSQNANFVYRISQMTGYNWAPYAKNAKLILPASETLINQMLKTRETNTTNTAKKEIYKEFIPMYSLYASDISYDTSIENTNNNQNTFTSIHSPMLIPKKYFNSGYTFDLQGKTTGLYEWRKSTNNTVQVNQFYNVSNIELVKEPIYGQMTKQNDGKYLYKPNLNKINSVDEFEYSAIVSKKDSTTNEGKIKVDYKVKIKLEGNNIEFVVPSNADYQQYYNQQEMPAKITNITFSNKNEHKYWNDKETTEKELYDGTLEKMFQLHPNEKDIILDIDLPQNSLVNSLSLLPHKDGHDGVPDGIKIEANGKVLYNDDVDRDTSKSTYEFGSIVTNKLKVTLSKYQYVDKIDPDGKPMNDPITGYPIKEKKPISRWTKIKEIEIGNTLRPSEILSSNSKWIHTVGDWRQGHKDAKINNSSLFTILPAAKIQFAFKGQSFSIVGTKDICYGSFDVYIDNKFFKNVQTNNNRRIGNEPLFIATSLGEGEHVVKIVTKSSSPVEIQYFSIFGEAIPLQVNDWYYFLAIGLPIILILAIALVAMITLYVLKNKKKNRNKNNFSNQENTIKNKPNKKPINSGGTK